MRNLSTDQPVRVPLSPSPHGIRIFAVADGLGGHLSGEMASQLVLSRLAETAFGTDEPVESVLTKFIEESHKELVELSRATPRHRGMGTTIAGIVVSSIGDVHIFHVGDSRIYRREDRYLQLLTKDDRPDDGTFGDPESVSNAKSMLLQCVGGVGDLVGIKPHVERINLGEKPEVFLLCSDGLSDMIAQDDIEEALADNHEKTVSSLFDRVCRAGAKDNVSIIIVEVLRDVSPADDQAAPGGHETSGVQS